MRKGFTLIELIVVIIILGVLAGIGITQYTKVVEKSHFAEASTILGSLRSLEIAYNLEYGTYAAVATLDPTIPAGACISTYYFSYACDTGTGTCTANRCTAGGKPPQGPPGLTKTLDVSGNFGGSVGY